VASCVPEDVGCNTGTDAVDWLERWGTRPNVSASWHRTADARVGEGMCSERRRWWGGSPDASRPVPKASSADPRVFCVEPMRGNLDVIRECSAKAFGRAEDPSFTVVKAAVGDRVGTARFPDAAPGEQKASLADAGSSNKTVEVNVTTVDVLMSQYGLTSLDVLTVDTEGFDPSVLLGAERTLQVVRYLLFEVHQDLSNSPWADTSLLGLVQKLDSKGLDCYWAGNLGNLSRLTGCWAEEDERRHRPTPWNNVACVRRGDIWHAVLEGFVR